MTKPHKTSPASQSAQSPATPDRDPLGPFEHAVIALFDGALAGVGFPGVDRTTLAETMRTVIEAQLVVEAAERDLDAARKELGERATELGKMARRAVAFARVLAEDDASLAEKLEALTPRTGEPARATRKRRARNDEPMLPTMTAEESAEDEVIAAE